MFMKVYFDHQVFCTQRYGGVSRYFVELSRALNKSDEIETAIVAPASINAYLNQDDNKHLLSFPLNLPNKGIRFRPNIFSPLFQLANWIGKPNVVHETCYGLGSKHITKQSSLVTTCHDMLLEKHPELAPDAAKQDIIKKRTSKRLNTFERADAIICISNHTKNDFIEVYPHLEHKVSMIHHGQTLAQLPPDSEMIIPSTPYLLFVGTRSKYKNFKNMLKAIGQSNYLRENFKIVCFGGGGLTVEEVEFSLRVGLGLDNIICLSGNDSLLASYYKHAAAFVFPSLYEGFGMPLLEAMAQGCPIACSSASCFPEICDDSAVYFDGNDVEDMSRAIEYIVQQPRDKFTSKLHERSTHFTWDRCAAQTLQVYKSIT